MAESIFMVAPLPVRSVKGEMILAHAEDGQPCNRPAANVPVGRVPDPAVNARIVV
jgi:hypothetical protein